MVTSDQKLAKLQAVLKQIDESLTREEFVQSFQNVIQIVLKVEKSLIDKISTQLDNGEKTLKQEFQDLQKEIQSNSSETIAELKQRVSESIIRLNNRIAKIQNGRDGQDGKDGKDGANGKDGINGKDAQPKTPEQTRDDLETLKDDERLDKSAVKGIEQIEKDVKEIKSRPSRVGGGKGITLYINGVKKLLTAQTINITGTGVSYAYANGRNDITITGGSGSLSVLAATGAVDDSNVTFTFASEPTLVVVNGATYRHGKGVTIATTTATLDNPVGSTGDIYGLG